jgi:ABC-type sugar transport system ATPase subunit
VLCDRVLVFRDGAVTAELAGDMTQDDIIHATFGLPAEQAPSAGRPGPHDQELNSEGVAR